MVDFNDVAVVLKRFERDLGLMNAEIIKKPSKPFTREEFTAELDRISSLLYDISVFLVQAQLVKRKLSEFTNEVSSRTTKGSVAKKYLGELEEWKITYKSVSYNLGERVRALRDLVNLINP